MPESKENENPFASQDASRGSSYYYRGSKPGETPYIDPDQLQSLAEGHYGITYLMLISFSVASGCWVFYPALLISETASGAWIIAISWAVLVGIVCFPIMKRVGIGLNWNPGSALPRSVLLGVNVFACGGVIGFIVVHAATNKALKRYGLNIHSLGVRRHDVAEKVDEMRQRKLSGETENEIEKLPSP